MVGKELAKKDKLLMNIEKDQQKIKELLSGIYTEIKENKNRYNDLYEEFKSSFQPAQQIKEEQLKKLRFLLQTNDLFYLETNKNDEKVFNDFNLDQRTILDKIEEIEREIKIFN
jgi:hypothetical protein